MLKKYLVFIVFVAAVLASSAAYAQPTIPDPKVVPPPNTPIDAGLGVLLAIGVGYAISKLRKED